ncbi:MAG: hypothetical protein BWY75_03762 [bacterium ADurb.Bin425]|nr:MAG: hypothetical protein BWY75_03762 [bacterium ADurb.Bin425]
MVEQKPSWFQNSGALLNYVERVIEVMQEIAHKDYVEALVFIA